jgi:hypothetical protein
MRSSAVAVALASLAAGVSGQFNPEAYPNLCGTFGDLSQCRTAGSQSIQETVELSGITSGNYVLTQKVFQDDGCDSTKLFSQLFAQGVWQDLGPLDTSGVTNQRRLMVNVASWQITPQTADWAASLNDISKGCPCGGTWVAGQMRTLTKCAQGSCANTQIFGSSIEQTKSGIAIGQPSFTVSVKNKTGFFLGRYDSVPSAGFDNGVDNEAEPAQFQANGTSCPTPTFPGTYCGEYTQFCSPEVDVAGDEIAQSFDATFQYCGGKAAGDFTLGSAGWFNRTYTLYSDTTCTTPKVTYNEVGTMNTGKLSDTGEDSYGFERWAGATTVTPFGAYTTTLALQCPCGGTWVDGQPRRLTQCRSSDGQQATCVDPGWYQNVSLGQPAYGVIRRAADGQDLDELQFSRPTADSTAASGMFLDGLGGFAYQLNSKDATCPFDTPSYDYCGTWNRECIANLNAGDSTDMVLMTGEGEDDGQILMYRQFFNPDTNCDEEMDVQLTVEATGYYSKMTVQDTHPGVLINYPTIYVTATNEGDMVEALNDKQYGCPCGGTWVSGVKRKLTSCPSGTCAGAKSKLFGAGTLGQPGYGLMTITGGKLQISDLDVTEDNIFPNGRFGIDSFPFELDAQCEPPKVDPTICGNYTQPCQSDGAITDFEVDFFYETMDAKNSYSMARRDYMPGTGCDQAAILEVKQEGTLKKMNALTAVKNGKAVELTPSSMVITPMNDDIAGRLQQACACGGTWAPNTARTFTAACPANTCTDESWLRQPIGVKSYGSMRKISTAMRMTSFNSDMKLGFENDLQPYDYALSVIDTDSCDPAPPQPAKKGGGADGGDIFIAIFFIGTAVYLVGGMLINYQTHGTARIPQIEMWKSIPGLVMGGIEYTFSCGKGSSGKYAEFGANPDNTYGSL